MSGRIDGCRGGCRGPSRLPLFGEARLRRPLKRGAIDAARFSLL